MHRLKKDALFLIDGSYILYRSYYGLRPLRTSSGIGVQAVYGFCRTIKNLIERFDPQNFAVVWDSKGKTFRSEIYEQYKATRQAPPSDLFIQKEYITKFLDSINLKQIAKTGYEADDLIGAIAKDYTGEQLVIVGPDKDLYQLLSEKVIIYDPFQEKIIDQESFEQEKGLAPVKVPFYYALLGDTSDNIPGVFGIGKKTALDLVNQFNSLEDLYNNLDQVKKERTRELLTQNKDNAFLSLKLFLLEYYDLNLHKKDFEFNKNNYIEAAKIFEELEFKSLLNDLKKTFGEKETLKRISGEHKVSQTRKSGEVQMSLFGPQKINTEEKQEKNWVCHTVLTKEELNNLIKNLKNAHEIAIDTETTGIRPLKDELVGISFAYNTKEAFYIPLTHQDETVKQLDLKDTLEKLKDIFLDNKIKKIFHNAKFDLLVFRQYNIEIKNVTFDTIIAANLLRHEDDKINLKVLSAKYLQEPMNTFKQVLNKYETFRQVPVNAASEYGAYDALQTFKLKIVLEQELKKYEKLQNIFDNLEMPLLFVLLDMEYEGIKLDPEKLKETGLEIQKDLKIVNDKIFAFIESEYGQQYRDINLNSPQQVQELLFDVLKLPVVKKTHTGTRGTDQDVLQELSDIHPVPGLILKYRELAKLLSTYVQPLIDEINPKTEKVHTSYSQTMVATGRLSSSNPNLQNIPVSSKHGLQIRASFVADSGCTFLAADYSQIELRVLAHITKDKNLIDAFEHNLDIHAKTSSQIFNVDIKDVTHEQRQIGKRINFSIMYGLTPYGLSKDLGIKPAQAKEYIDKFFEVYSGVATWIEQTLEQAKRDGYTQTLMGRRRYVLGLQEKNKNLYQAAARIAINSPVQGTSAELIKIAMLNIDKKLKDMGSKSKIILQIHDELVLQVPNNEIENIEKLVKKEMENAQNWDISLKISTKTGKNWEEITK
ncbi:MAG: polymerase I protein [candidate division TM6 bacterium GW2011_GWF2_28_16]|nr:MAG: polymerase I protein [candidate division TM6 bacterium GW2011_GWF2_28_16]